MKETLRVGAIQMESGVDRDANLASAVRLVEQAARQGAHLVVLPELFNYLGCLDSLSEHAEPPDGPTVTTMRETARRLEILLCAGSYAASDSEDSPKVANRSLLIDATGEVISTYDKIHCFDVELPDVEIRESTVVAAGRSVRVTATPYGPVGQAICYDLRFPELFRQMTHEGMRIGLLPSAFTDRTGRAHWEILLRARAIENQIFLVAANQAGRIDGRIACHGHTCIIGPWGDVLAMAPGDGEGVVMAEIDLSDLERVRREMPVENHHRIHTFI